MDVTNQAFEEYAKKYADTVFRVALGILRNQHDSEDAMQNTLMRFFRHKDQFDDDEHIKAWLIRVASNESKRILKKNAGLSLVDLETVAAKAYGDDTASRELFLQIMSLEEKYRSAVYLHYYERYTAEEIGKLTGTSASTVRTRLSRAREMLKDALED